MTVQEAKRATLELLGSSDESDVDYIDEALLAEYEDAEQSTKGDEQDDADPPEGAPETGPEFMVRYGNSLVMGPERGRLHFKNGTPTHPNDPCGRTYRRWVQMTPGSTIDPFRACGGYQGYRITVY
jgi:hypothetical protein